MAEYQQKELSGTLFKNTRKTEGSNQPDYQGDAMIRGKKLRISAWIKQGSKGSFMSLAFQEPYVPEEKIVDTRPVDTEWVAAYEKVEREEIPF